MSVASSKIVRTAFRCKIFICSYISATLIFAATACAGGDMILQLKDVQNFKIQQTSSSPVVIKLSGLVFHSSLVVKNIASSQHDEYLEILVHLKPTSSGLSGNFECDFVVPPSVSSVTFGKEKVVIWNRNTGAVQRTAVTRHPRN